MSVVVEMRIVLVSNYKMSVNKKQLFEAILLEITKWYKEKNWSLENNNLGRLKVWKLLFLLVINNKELLDVFDNFQARATWPVEKDVYDFIKQDKLNIFSISEKILKIKPNSYNNIDEKHKTLAKKFINNLRTKNDDLINLTVSELVDLTKKYSCWRLAREFKQEKISKEMMMVEEKVL